MGESAGGGRLGSSTRERNLSGAMERLMSMGSSLSDDETTENRDEE